MFLHFNFEGKVKNGLASSQFIIKDSIGKYMKNNPKIQVHVGKSAKEKIKYIISQKYEAACAKIQQ